MRRLVMASGGEHRRGGGQEEEEEEAGGGEGKGGKGGERAGDAERGGWGAVLAVLQACAGMGGKGEADTFQTTCMLVHDQGLKVRGRRRWREGDGGGRGGGGVYGRRWWCRCSCVVSLFFSLST